MKPAISSRQASQSRGATPASSSAEERPRVAHQPDRGRHVLPDLRRIELDVDHLRAAGEAREVAGDPVVEPKPDAEDQIGLLDRPVDVHLAVHARHAEVQRVRLGETR